MTARHHGTRWSGAILLGMAMLPVVATAQTRIDFNAVPQIRQLFGSWPLPDIIDGACSRDGESGICLRRQGAQPATQELFVSVRDGRAFGIWEPPSAHRHDSRVHSASDRTTFPADLGRTGDIRRALRSDAPCPMLVVNRVQAEEARPLGWLRTFIDLQNNTGRDVFYGIEFWNGEHSGRLPRGTLQSQYLENLILAADGVWAFVFELDRAQRGTGFSASTWRPGDVQATFLRCPAPTITPGG